MLGFILLRGKEFNVPVDISTAIIGLFFGLVCGLFYYQRYYKAYYWAFSLGGGLLLTYLSRWAFSEWGGTRDDTRSLELTLASFMLPFFFTLVLNYGLSRIKRRKRKRHSKHKEYSSFFDVAGTQDIPKSSGPPAKAHGKM